MHTVAKNEPAVILPIIIWPVISKGIIYPQVPMDFEQKCSGPIVMYCHKQSVPSFSSLPFITIFSCQVILVVSSLLFFQYYKVTCKTVDISFYLHCLTCTVH